MGSKWQLSLLLVFLILLGVIRAHHLFKLEWAWNGLMRQGSPHIALSQLLGLKTTTTTTNKTNSNVNSLCGFRAEPNNFLVEKTNRKLLLSMLQKSQITLIHGLSSLVFLRIMRREFIIREQCLHNSDSQLTTSVREHNAESTYERAHCQKRFVSKQKK